MHCMNVNNYSQIIVWEMFNFEKKKPRLMICSHCFNVDKKKIKDNKISENCFRRLLNLKWTLNPFDWRKIWTKQQKAIFKLKVLNKTAQVFSESTDLD